jgi:hypothetical protein
MGFDPSRIPLIAHAFDEFDYALTDFGPDDVRVVDDSGERPLSALAVGKSGPFQPSSGWRGHCERHGVTASQSPLVA